MIQNCISLCFVLSNLVMNSLKQLQESLGASVWYHNIEIKGICGEISW